ncbi:MAG: class I SAM-dependent methyltransferase [Chlamydiota bacterium]
MHDYAPPTSHYEYSVKTASGVDSGKRFKQTAIYAMRQLQGWCSEYKASTLMDLVWLTRPQVIVEIGVFGGKSLVPMAYALKALGTGGVIYGIDPWSAQASAEGQDGSNQDYWANLDHDGILRELQNKISIFNLSSQIDLVRATSEKADPIENIDILHVDGNHSNDASYYDICKWGPLVRKGGMIIFDDITWSTIDKALVYLDQNYTKFLQIDDEENSWGIWIKP